MSSDDFSRLEKDFSVSLEPPRAVTADNNGHTHPIGPPRVVRVRVKRVDQLEVEGVELEGVEVEGADRVEVQGPGVAQVQRVHLEGPAPHRPWRCS